MNSGLPPSMMSVPRPAMLVAMVTAPLPPGLGHDLGLALVVLGVQHLVRDPVLLEHLGQALGLLHAGRADQDRLALFVPLGDVRHAGLELGCAVW